eukprot:2169570-Rhodomonas_salina.1
MMKEGVDYEDSFSPARCGKPHHHVHHRCGRHGAPLCRSEPGLHPGRQNRGPGREWAILHHSTSGVRRGAGSCIMIHGMQTLVRRSQLKQGTPPYVRRLDKGPRIQDSWLRGVDLGPSG